MSPPNYLFPLVDRRKELGITQKQIAECLNVDERTVSHWEQGHHLPRLTPLQTEDLCNLLEWDISQLAASFRALQKAKS